MFWIILGAAFALLLAVILLRAAFFNPKKQPAISDETVSFDKESAVSALQELVKCKTISYNDKALEDDGEFKKLITMLPNLYPRVFDTCSFRELPVRVSPHN